MIHKILIFISFLFSTAIYSQEPFTVHITPSQLQAIPAVHSGSFAAHNGRWIFIGGRRDGLHTMQSNQAFPKMFRNDSVYIVNPLTDSYKAVCITSLSHSLSEPLSSANMQSFQNGNYLYMIGGYGYSDSLNVYKTFPSLISIDLPSLINAVDSGTSIAGSFRQITDSVFTVTGGALDKIDSTYYLIFGHDFQGRYAATQSTLFSQQYTHEIRKFNISDDGINLSVFNYSAIKDTDVFHRRDFNLARQIFPDHQRGLTVFGGVFKKNTRLPFLTPIDIKSSSVIHQSAFNENLNQYTTAFLPLFDSTNNFMHTVFFGGLSLFTLDSNMNLSQDTLVPFVSTISKITRDPSGNFSESKMLESMPALKGANAYFIPDSTINAFRDGILFINEVSGNTRVGFIAGGIHSDAPNVGDIDPEGMSRPNGILYEVWIDKNVSEIPEVEIKNEVNNLEGFPNPANDNYSIMFTLNSEMETDIKLYNYSGELVRTFLETKKLNGKQNLKYSLNGIANGIYLCSVRAGRSVKILRVVIKK